MHKERGIVIIYNLVTFSNRDYWLDNIEKSSDCFSDYVCGRGLNNGEHYNGQRKTRSNTPCDFTIKNNLHLARHIKQNYDLC